MSEVLILEFDGGTVDHYNAVNAILGVTEDGGGDWPAPLETHVAGYSDGALVVVEVWESRAAQAEFMGRLAPALAEAAVPPPSRMEWLTLAGRHTA